MICRQQFLRESCCLRPGTKHLATLSRGFYILAGKFGATYRRMTVCIGSASTSQALSKSAARRFESSSSLLIPACADRSGLDMTAAVECAAVRSCCSCIYQGACLSRIRQSRFRPRGCHSLALDQQCGRCKKSQLHTVGGSSHMTCCMPWLASHHQHAVLDLENLVFDRTCEGKQVPLRLGPVKLQICVSLR